MAMQTKRQEIRYKLQLFATVKGWCWGCRQGATVGRPVGECGNGARLGVVAGGYGRADGQIVTRLSALVVPTALVLTTI